MASEKLGEALTCLDYPNGGKDAVFAEANLVAYTTHGLLSQKPVFHCYAEASHTRGRRIDLLAFNREIALAIEAKKFGDIEHASDGIIEDVQRIRDFTPTTSPLAANIDANDWWRQAKERWGLILVGSHAGDEVARAWQSGGGESARLSLSERSLRNRAKPEKLDRANEKLLKALATINEDPGSQFGCFRICEGRRWEGSTDAYLLWAAFPLK